MIQDDGRAYITVWPFSDAPERFRALSTFHGDEDWIVVTPEEMPRPPWVEIMSPDYETHWIDGDGLTVYITGHA